MAELSLRELLRGPIVDLHHRGHKELPSVCERLGMPTPRPEGSRRERMLSSYDALSNADLSKVAEKFLRLFPPAAKLRNRIQDAVWAEMDIPEIPKRHRRELARSLTSEDIYLNSTEFEKLLERLWIIDDDLLGGIDDDTLDAIWSGRATGLRGEIHRHIFRNPGDWTVEYLFERLGAFDCSDGRFAQFLEGLASGDVRPDMQQQHQFVRVVNESLRNCGVELRETGTEGGYPSFEIVRCVEGVPGRPKNLIFASHVKPDLRFRDAVNNDVEIVSNADSVLVYDRQISSGGLPWKDLQDWWADREHLSSDVAKKALYKRLLASLPTNSPPQRFVFENYFKRFRQAIPVLPALLPEVWLHWDPKTIKERGRDALLRFRMDFLMLLPNSVRVVIEVDGKHHYADEQGRASPHDYGAMMAADRDLRLTGYEVYRFGSNELCGEQAASIVVGFFERLFKFHHVTLPG